MCTREVGKVGQVGSIEFQRGSLDVLVSVSLMTSLRSLVGGAVLHLSHSNNSSSNHNSSKLVVLNNSSNSSNKASAGIFPVTGTLLEGQHKGGIRVGVMPGETEPLVD